MPQPFACAARAGVGPQQASALARQQPDGGGAVGRHRWTANIGNNQYERPKPHTPPPDAGSKLDNAHDFASGASSTNPRNEPGRYARRQR